MRDGRGNEWIQPTHEQLHWNAHTILLPVPCYFAGIYSVCIGVSSPLQQW